MARTRKRWWDLTAAQRTRVAALGVLQLGLLTTALADIHRRPASAIKGGKRLWTALSFVNIIGPLAYFAFGRKREVAAG